MTYANKCLERAEKATKGPWSFRGWTVNAIYDDDAFPLQVNTEFESAKQDAEFIAHARTDVPELARRLKKACESLRGIGLATGTKYPDELADELENDQITDERQKILKASAGADLIIQNQALKNENEKIRNLWNNLSTYCDTLRKRIAKLRECIDFIADKTSAVSDPVAWPIAWKTRAQDDEMEKE
jgi:hypothetical protein